MDKTMDDPGSLPPDLLEKYKAACDKLGHRRWACLLTAGGKSYRLSSLAARAQGAARAWQANPAAIGVPATMFSSWRLFSEELLKANIHIMMKLGARHLNV